MTTALGLDFSYWQGIAPDSTPADFYADGHRVVAPGAWHGATANIYCEENLTRFDQHGDYVLGTYGVVHRWRSAEEHIERAVEQVGAKWDDLSFFAIDVEMETDVDQILRAEELVIAYGAEPILYIAGWVVDAGLVRGPIADLTHMWLWYAYYGVVPTLDVERQDPRLPWRNSKVIGHQFRNTHTEHGFVLDSNLFNMDVVRSLKRAEVEEDEMIQARVAAAGVFLEIETKLALNLPIPSEIKGQAVYLLGGAAPSIATARATLAVLYRYAAARALRGEQMDVETTWRLRAALQ